MIVVTMELWRHGDPARRKHLGQLTISNVGGSQSDPEGLYRVELDAPGRSQIQEAVLAGFKRSRGAWVLLRKALKALEGRRP